MRRRQLLAGVGTLIGAAGVGGVVYLWQSGGQASATQREPPATAKEVKPLAEAFYAHISQYYQNARVWVSADGELAMSFKADAEGEAGLLKEFTRVADEYAAVANEFEPRSLTMIVGEVQAVVSKPSIRAYLNGEINERAYHKTIEVTDIGRRSN